MPMKIFGRSDPLTEAEFEHLGKFLQICNNSKAMNVEEVDGFFAALIVGCEGFIIADCRRGHLVMALDLQCDPAASDAVKAHAIRNR